VRQPRLKATARTVVQEPWREEEQVVELPVARGFDEAERERRVGVKRSNVAGSIS
jgi:hypothetical protein